MRGVAAQEVCEGPPEKDHLEAVLEFKSCQPPM